MNCHQFRNINQGISLSTRSWNLRFSRGFIPLKRSYPKNSMHIDFNFGTNKKPDDAMDLSEFK
jgi:hypothetical protein